MRVVQLSDLHLGPEDHEHDAMRRANRLAWHHARQTAAKLREWPDAEELVVVITGDLTDEGHVNPAEFGPVAEWLATLPGTVLAVPGNHDVGNFASSTATPRIDETYLRQWREAIGPDRWSHAVPRHRLVGLNSMLIGSDLPAEAEQRRWLNEQLDEAQDEGQRVWVYQHAPLFLREFDEVRSAREHYWCPAAGPRDTMLAMLDRQHVVGLAHGHVHRRADTRSRITRAGRGGRTPLVVRSCPALSGTHSEADYFRALPGVDQHDLLMWTFLDDHAEWYWEDAGVPTTTRYVS
jgi:3',5'-cyclic AMP phosphodiesterase CpdA